MVQASLLHVNRRQMAEILPARLKTAINQSIIQSINQSFNHLTFILSALREELEEDKQVYKND